MDFSVSPRVVELKARARQIIDTHVIPLEPLAAQGWAKVEPKLYEVRKLVREAGLLSPQASKDLGGAGLTFLEHAALSEELGRSGLGHFAFNCQAPDSGNMELLHLFGSDDQKKRFMEPLIRGEIRSCFSMTEPEHAGSNPTWLGTRARLEGGEWVIDGHKWFTSSADGASFAIVMAVTEPDAPPHLRASQIIVPMNTPGLTLVRNVSIMGHEGSGWMSHAELRYENVRVPESNLIGGRGMGFLLAQERLGPGRIHHCMRWIGICERSFDLMCKHVVSRQLSPGKPLALKGPVQEWIAESRAEIDAARLSVMHAAWSIDKHGSKEARDQISAIKFFVAGVMERVVDRAIQAHGALGMTDDLPLAGFYAHERAARIYDGPDEVHKASLAKRILGTYGLTSERK
ncbi:MAG: acyl-CoA dehydrogenase family protein [Deltaproteobacteria bacterium]|nr:acyl-CoA dehydrogenase family protein [Deltaproteobacteria bacterium]